RRASVERNTALRAAGREAVEVVAEVRPAVRGVRRAVRVRVAEVELAHGEDGGSRPVGRVRRARRGRGGERAPAARARGAAGAGGGGGGGGGDAAGAS